MEKAFAYVCAAPDAAPRLLKRYCRKIYELGYVPICPKLSDSQYLQMENADEKREIQFALAANQLHHFMPVRAATDGRFKYIRSYIPYRQFALRNYYQWGMPSI